MRRSSLILLLFFPHFARGMCMPLRLAFLHTHRRVLKGREREKMSDSSSLYGHWCVCVERTHAHIFFFSPFFFLFGCPCDITGHERTVHLYCTCVCVCKGIHRSAFFFEGWWWWADEGIRRRRTQRMCREREDDDQIPIPRFFFLLIHSKRERERPWLSVITHHLFSRGEEEEENRRRWFCFPTPKMRGGIYFFDCLIVFFFSFFVFNFDFFKKNKTKKF